MQKTLTVDWDNVLAVGKLMNTFKSRFFELKRAQDNRPTRKQQFQGVFDACQRVMDFDISHLYSGLSLDASPEYYVYAHLDARKRIAPGVNGVTTFAATLGMERIPFYIGKGIGNRCFEIRRSETHSKIVQAMRGLNMEAQVFKVRTGLTESEALQLEAKLIDVFGLLPNRGYLTNLDEGFNSRARHDCYLPDLIKIRRINEVLQASAA